MKVARVGLLFVVVLLFAFTLAAPRVSIERLVDLSTQYVNEHTYYDVTNTDTSALNSFEVAVLSKNLAYSDIKVVKEIKREFENVNGETERDIVEEEFPVEITATRKETHHDLEYTIFTIAFSKPIATKKTVLVKVTALYTHALQNLPAEITQSELQKNIYEGNHYIASVYQSEKQYTEFRVLKLVDQTPLKPFHADIGGQSAAYGPYNDVAPFSHSKCRLHFHNMAPFLTITEMTREIEVSHWGNIAIEEDVKIQNDGAKLKGGFSRLDYMHGQRANGVNEIVSYLPKGAIDVYYRDVIGNVSSSHVFPHAKKVKLELTPRFVIFGGWKSQHTIGYNLPTARYLTVDGSQHVLSIPFVDTIENVVIDNVEFQVILPEGSSNVQVTAPYPISTITHSNRVTYLDTEGRVVVSFKASNLVPAYHHARLVISYDFTATSFYTEPFLLIGGFFALFLAAIFYFKVNLQIQESEGDHDEIDPEVAGLIDKVLNEVHRIDTSIEEAKKQADLSRTSNSNAIKNLADKISSKSQDLGTVVRELNKAYLRKIQLKGKLLSKKDDQTLLNELQDVNKSINALVDHLNNAI